MVSASNVWSFAIFRGHSFCQCFQYWYWRKVVWYIMLAWFIWLCYLHKCISICMLPHFNKCLLYILCCDLERFLKLTDIHFFKITFILFAITMVTWKKMCKKNPSNCHCLKFFQYMYCNQSVEMSITQHFLRKWKTFKRKKKIIDMNMSAI